jgi:hypothetical protein
MSEIPEETKQLHEETDMLNIGIGSKERSKLNAAKVKIVDIIVQKIKTSSKLVCVCKHPERMEAVSISELKYEHNGKLEEVGLWVNLDDDKKIVKGSALAVFLAATKCSTAAELKGKDVETVLDSKGYLCFKCY